MRRKTILLLVLLAALLLAQWNTFVDIANSMNKTSEELIYDALMSERSSITMISYHMTPEELSSAWSHVIYDNAELFFVADRYEYKAIGNFVLSVRPIYAVSGDALETARQVYNEALTEILGTLQPEWTDLQTALYLHDYLCSRYAYDESLTRYSAYEFLIDGMGVCQAYTLVYDELLSACGIDSSYVVSREMNHAWNVVTIDGVRYNVDVTYDDPTPDHLGRVSHRSFLRSDAGFSDNHSYTANEGYGQCTDPFYDSGAVWENVNTAFVPIGNDFYYIKSGMLYRWDGSFSEYIDTIYATWFTDRGDHTYWKGNYSTLWAYDGKLLYSKPDCIMAYDPADESFTQIYQHNSTGNIYGFQIIDGELRLHLSYSPNDAGEVMVLAPNKW